MKAKDYLTTGVTCAVIQKDKVFQAHTSGIQPLLDWLKEEVCPLTTVSYTHLVWVMARAT